MTRSHNPHEQLNSRVCSGMYRYIPQTHMRNSIKAALGSHFYGLS